MMARDQTASALSFDHDEVFDAVVVGTGFAGAVTAARLVEAGLRICVLERGRRFNAHDFPMYPDQDRFLEIDGGKAQTGETPDLSRWFWSVDHGLFDIRDLDDVIAVQAAGYGGGSLIYANVHLRAPKEVFEQGWPKAYRRETLDVYYDRVAYMLEAKPLPPAERLRKAYQLKRVADADQLADRVQAINPPLAITFDVDADQERRQRERPWTKGRQQQACDMRGQCWLGCRKQAKNSLDLNYLGIVEDAFTQGLDGTRKPLADIHTLAEVIKIEHVDGDLDPSAHARGARYRVHYQDRLIATTNAKRNETSSGRVCLAKNLFLCAGAVNTTELLLRSQETLMPKSTPFATSRRRLGHGYFPNADSFAAVFDCDEPHHADHGPTITQGLLYHRRRGMAAGEPGDDEDGRRWLWAIDFKTGPEHSLPPAEALRAGAEILLGDQAACLVQPPLFDFGGFENKPGFAMIVVEGSSSMRSPAGQAVAIGHGERRGRAFGIIVGDPRPLEDWFLVEDGGYPTAFEPMLGLLRSPLWLRRNRFLEHGGRARQRELAASSGPLQFPMATLLASVFGAPRQAASGSSDVDMPAFSPSAPFRLSIKDILPREVMDALTNNREQLAQMLAPMIEPMLERVLDDIAEKVVGRFDLTDLGDSFGLAAGSAIRDLPTDKKEMLVRGLLRQTIQMLWGSEVALAQRINAILMDHVPTDIDGLADLLSPLVGWLLQYREGNGHTGLLLLMGRDQYRGRLSISGATGRLCASLPKPLAPSSRRTQEQVMRDIAKLWQGELRTNPAWTTLKRRATVHSQGGCPMGQDHDVRVTDPLGRLAGFEGLYVMDAAAFPSAVGVNPSATIAAVAEYKVERFLEAYLAEDDARRYRALREAGDHKVRAWIDQQKHDHQDDDLFDPLSKMQPGSSSKPAAGTLGLAFNERIAGLFSRPDPAASRTVIDWSDLTAVDRERADFEAAERQGVTSNFLVRLDVVARIDDLDRFLKIQRAGMLARIGLSGRLIIKDHGETTLIDVCPERSHAEFFGGQDEKDIQRYPMKTRFLRYHIVTMSEGRRYRIEAAKVLRDDTRFDVWQDLSTLYVDVFDDETPGEPAPPLSRGIMRLSPVDFFDEQLRSIKVTPDDADLARRSWAYAAFLTYFSDELAGVYSARRGHINALFRGLLDPMAGI